MNSTTREFKRKITLSFKVLRLLGYWCKQNHSCCTTCGWADIPNGMEDRVVFYSNQDYEQLKNNAEELYLSWCGDHKKIINVLVFCGIDASCENPGDMKIKCLTGNDIYDYI